MSFEGYYQALCANGHYNIFDTYSYAFDDVCKYCGADIIKTSQPVYYIPEQNDVDHDCDDGGD